jgi:N-acetylglucosaminyldiphosphoundecaprenol N-acetyl-beta-D-mannosaminyltransferase
VTPTRDRIRLLDVEVTAVAERDVPGMLGGLISAGGRRTVVGHNLHSVYLYHTQAELAALYDSADLVLLDGSPLFALWRIQQPRPRPDSRFRVGSTDWIRHLGQVEGLHRLAVVGAGQESNAEACRRLQRWLPSVTVLGLAGDPWNRAREDFVVDQLTAFRPQLVLVGLGMPLQESLLWRRRDSLPEAVYCAVGGALDQISGRQRLAPRWLGRLGFEWLWRLLLSPRRVVGRVMIEPWKLTVLLVRRRRPATGAKAAR